MQREQLEHVGAIIVVGSGKGGVGKSDELPCLGRIPFDSVAVLNSDKRYSIVVSLAGTPSATAFSQLTEQTMQPVAELRSNAMSDKASQTLDIKEESYEGET